MRLAMLSLVAVMFSMGTPVLAQTPFRTPEQLEANYDAHSDDFDYLLGDWEFTATSKEFGKGLNDVGTAERVGGEVRIEQKFGVMSANPVVRRIRYYNIAPDRFSWVSDLSRDGGRTWEMDNLQIEARRIGPSRSLGSLAPARNQPAKP